MKYIFAVILFAFCLSTPMAQAGCMYPTKEMEKKFLQRVDLIFDGSVHHIQGEKNDSHFKVTFKVDDIQRGDKNLKNNKIQALLPVSLMAPKYSSGPHLSKGHIIREGLETTFYFKHKEGEENSWKYLAPSYCPQVRSN